MERKPPRRTRERILDLSLRLFNDFGEPNVNTTLIAEQMAISPGNLYYHFKNKDDIIESIFQQFERELDKLLAVPKSNQGQRPPNVVFILADDLGYNDITLNGGGVAGGSVPTPAIDSIAREGVTFAAGAGSGVFSANRMRSGTLILPSCRSRSRSIKMAS